MTSRLELAPGFSLPLNAATRRLAILAMSGAGKSNTAVVLAEAMFAAPGPCWPYTKPGLPLTRAYPSAAYPAPCSWRGVTCRMPYAARCR